MAGRTACSLCGRSLGQRGRDGRRIYCKRCTAKSDRSIAERLRARCKECGRAFTTAKRSVRYCSDECSAEGARRSRRESNIRRMADPEKHAIAAAHMRARNAARRGRESGG